MTNVSNKPKIAVVAVGLAAIQAMIDLIPKIPDAKFIAYPALNQPLKINELTTSDTTKYMNSYREDLKYRTFPRSSALPDKNSLANMFVGYNRWEGMRMEKGDEIWFWTSSEMSWKCLVGRAGIALVRDGNVIDAKVFLMN
jgi:hypothetical protein